MIVNADNRQAIDCILRGAELAIMLQTGMDVELVPNHKRREMPGEVQELMGVIAKSLEQTMDDYFGGNQRRYVDLRCIATMFIRKYYPNMTLKIIGEYMGGQDHTTVLHSGQRAAALLETNEYVFTKKYGIALKAVIEWIKE